MDTKFEKVDPAESPFGGLNAPSPVDAATFLELGGLDVPVVAKDRDSLPQVEAALLELLEFSKDIEELGSILDRLAPNKRYFSSTTFEAKHLVGVLNRFIDSNITAEEVEDWANLVESQSEYLHYSKSEETKLRGAIYKLANPTLTQELSVDFAKQLIESLH